MRYRVRTFIAVEIEPFPRDRLHGVVRPFASQVGPAVKWVDPGNWHVTLLFLGDVDPGQELVNVCRAVEAVCYKHPPVAFTLAGLNAFPNARRPRTLVAAVGEGVEALTSLHDALEEPLLELGCYRREDRIYTPHLTLGRVVADADAEALGQLIRQYGRWQGGQSTASEVLVLSSDLEPEGPVYNVLSRSTLRGKAPPPAS